MYVIGTSLAHKGGYDMKIMYKGKTLRCDRPLRAANMKGVELPMKIGIEMAGPILSIMRRLLSDILL